MSPKVNFELWVVMLCHGRFISCNKCTTLIGDVDNGGRYKCVGAGVHGKFQYLPLNFAGNLKLLFKNKLFKKLQHIRQRQKNVTYQDKLMAY